MKSIPEKIDPTLLIVTFNVRNLYSNILQELGQQAIFENTPLYGPHYLNILNHSWPSDRLVVSLISGQGYIIFLFRLLRHNIHKVEEKRTKKKQHGIELTPSATRETFVTLSYHSVLLWDIASVHSSEIPSMSSGTLTHPPMLAKPASGSTGPSGPLSLTIGFPRLLSTALSCWLPWSIDCPVLFYLRTLPSLVHFWSPGRSCAQALCVV